jgi:hypothetical protein
VGLEILAKARLNIIPGDSPASSDHTAAIAA